MSDGIELERVLRRAVAAEYSAAFFYTAIADGVADEGIAAAFRELADEERVHAVAIEAVGDRFTGSVRPGFSGADFAAVETPPGWEGEGALSVARAFELAGAAEVNAAQVYESLAETFEGKNSELFAGLARSEKGHAIRLQELARRCPDETLSGEIALDPSTFAAAYPAEGDGAAAGSDDSIWESGEDLISHATMMTNVWSQTLSDSTPSGSGASVLRRVLGGHSHGIRHMAFSPDGRYLITVDTSSEIFVWSTSDGRLITPLDAPTDGVSALSISPDGCNVAVGSPSGGITLWDLSTLDED